MCSIKTITYNRKHTHLGNSCNSANLSSEIQEVCCARTMLGLHGPSH